MKKRNAPIIQSLLDLDLYKLTQGLHARHYFPDVEVRYDFVNRTRVNLADFIEVEQLQAELDHVRTLSLTKLEKMFLLGQPFFARYASFIDELEHPNLPPVRVYCGEDGKLAISVQGKWFPTILWETIILSVVNELYYRAVLEDRSLSLSKVYSNGERIIREKVEFFRKHTELTGKIIEFGTRRRFSREWQDRALGYYLSDVGDHFIGTSNVKLAMKYGVKPIGTMAHELTMFYDAYYGNAESQNQALQDWHDLFDGALDLGLTDTFGSDFYFNNLMGGIAGQYRGHRQDSGDPHDWTRKMIAACKLNDIDSTTKLAVYSDGLEPQTMVDIVGPWQDQVIPVFGWGTNCSNDLGLAALSIVVKMTMIFKDGIWIPTVKLSDNMNKAIGPEEAIVERKIRYGHTHDNRETCVY